ncbi:MAG: fumarylacetoacetate hydrolase family protein [Pseudomonadota bacterium]|nr:fumarylacetoacetate hydrolase family protein [Pseudomonadota bacterium]
MPIVTAKTRFMAQAERFEVDPTSCSIRFGARTLGMSELQWDIPTCGAVYGVLLNYRGALDRFKDDDSSPAPPRAPVLFVKPANTWVAYGDAIPIPADATSIEAGAALGIVMGRTASRIAAVDALNFVAGYTIVNDVCESHQRFDRAATRERCRDGFCAIGPWIVPGQSLPPPDSLTLRVLVNGVSRADSTTANMVRSVAKLIADVSEFVTLAAGDILHTGVPEHAVPIGSGDRVRIEVDGLGALENYVVGERDLMSGGLR